MTVDKKCNKCKEVKPLESFSKLSGSKDGLRYNCKACSNAASKAWREANSEKAKATRKAWDEANLEKVKATKKAWIEANPEKVEARRKAWVDRRKAWVEANPDKVKASNKAYYEANQEKGKTDSKAWAQANPDRTAAIKGKGLAIRRGASVSGIYDLELCIAFYTESRRLTIETGIQHHVDHIVPLSKGGLHCQNNLQVLTAKENLEKGDSL